MMRMKVKISALLGLCALAATELALAHHSNVNFDRSRTVAVTGTVKEFRWTNPHMWLYLLVPDGKGGTDTWSLEGGSVSIAIKNGWKSTSLPPGTKVRALVAPNKDGSTGGEVMSVRFEDGKVLSFGII